MTSDSVTKAREWQDPEEVGAWAEIDLDGTIKTPSRLSFSSLSTYAECGELWRLTRGFRRPSSSWWANVGGSTVHELSELYDKGEELPSFQEVFTKLEAEYEGVELLPSGKKKLSEMTFEGGPNGKDKAWWLHYGPLMVQAYIDWRNQQVDSFRIISIEHPFEQVVGGETLIGHIDRVEIHLPTGTLWIRDVKTGNSGGYLQLASYREGLERETGMRADWGDLIKFRALKEKRSVPELDPETGQQRFYVKGPKKGMPKMVERNVDVGVECFTTRPTDFTGYTSEYVENVYEMARRGIENGVFLPNARNNCRYCGVNEFCRSYGGDKGLTYPVKSAIVSGKVVGDTAEKSSV